LIFWNEYLKCKNNFWIYFSGINLGSVKSNSGKYFPKLKWLLESVFLNEKLTFRKPFLKIKFALWKIFFKNIFWKTFFHKTLKFWKKICIRKTFSKFVSKTISEIQIKTILSNQTFATLFVRHRGFSPLLTTPLQQLL